MKVLLVEDDVAIAKNVTKGLEILGYAVDWAQDGVSGLDLGLNEVYDAIILDLLLPEMDGITVCKELRKQSVQTPIIMLTALSQTQDTVDGLSAGADDYLAKPFAFEELHARLQALARRKDKEFSVALSVHDLELDPQTFSAQRDGMPIKLSQKEFALLEFLMRNKGKVFSKEQLVEKVWPFDSDILPNTVQVYIGYLRSKIDTAFPEKQPLLKTVRGFGYSIDEGAGT